MPGQLVAIIHITVKPLHVLPHKTYMLYIVGLHSHILILKKKPLAIHSEFRNTHTAEEGAMYMFGVIILASEGP